MAKDVKQYKKTTDKKSSEKESVKKDGYFDSLIDQVNVEYQLAWDQQYNKIQTHLTRLKLYNNQKRDANAVGDSLLFTVMQTVLASLYNDHLGVEFLGREEGDAETAENLTALAKFDYDKMAKDKLDHDWLWDTLFFGRGLVKLMEFDRSDEYMCPIPELIDPMTFLHDPQATSVNGDIRGRGSMRFGGREIYTTKLDISDKNGYFDFKDLKSDEEVKSLLKRAKEARDEAAGLDNIQNKSETALGDNMRVGLLEWYTVWNGKKCMVVLGNNKSRVIKYVELKGEKWPIIDRPMYPTAHDWDGTSIPDLVEDKQRQRAVAINLGLQSMKSDMYPMYVYDESRIKNKSDLMNFDFNKFVGVKGQGDVAAAVRPMNKATPRLDVVSFIMDTLDASAQRATATPEMQQGNVSDDKRTLGELNLVASKVDTRYSLTAKIFGWSDRDFWLQWYNLYKEHFKSDIDEKVIRVVGSMGSKWRGLTRENIIGSRDPDIYIESRAVSENKKLKDRMLLTAYGQLVLNDPMATGKRYFMKKLGKLNGLAKDEVDRIFPPTVDEVIAEDENEKLNQDDMVTVNPEDDDMMHMEIHAKALDTKAKAAHIFAHKKMMLAKRNQAQQAAMQQGQMPGMPQPAAMPKDPGQVPEPNLLNQMPTANQLTPSATASAPSL